jgi:hypothetical protein
VPIADREQLAHVIIHNRSGVNWGITHDLRVATMSIHRSPTPPSVGAWPALDRSFGSLHNHVQADRWTVLPTACRWGRPETDDLCHPHALDGDEA